jgi:glucose-6-phosphate 1-dehydrogenase
MSYKDVALSDHAFRMNWSAMNTQNGKPTTIVIFGASGDLNKRKLIPSLLNLFRKDRLPQDFQIVGYSRRAWSNQDFHEELHKSFAELAKIQVEDTEWSDFKQKIHHVQGGFDKASDFQHLADTLNVIEPESCNRLYYLAVPPQYFIDILNGLSMAGLVSEEEGWRRVVVEKPFGSDLASAKELNHAIHSILDEKQIYRIDHYLGKETVQNILVFRFANTIFEPLWNRNYIDHVQITVAEEVGVMHRAGYYDGVGVIRDMFQNHLLQLLTLVAMEPPAIFEADALRNEKTKVLRSIRPVSEKDVKQHLVRGQYDGYLEAEGVAPNSDTPTFAALSLYIDNWRWQGVPFYLRSGKNLQAKSTEVVIHFRCPPHLMFPLPPGYEIPANILTLCIQPDEGIHLRFDAKVPDTPADMRTVDMDFHYAETFGKTSIPDAYDRLLLDVLNGDASLFTRADSIELAWTIMEPFIHVPQDADAHKLHRYSPGSWGPDEADAFMNVDGRKWLRGCAIHTKDKH